MDLKVIMKQHSSELEPTGLPAIPLLSEPRRKGSGPWGRALLVSQGCDLPDGQRILSRSFLAVSDVGLSLGKLPKQDGRTDRS